jgi:hypothetical protein
VSIEYHHYEVNDDCEGGYFVVNENVAVAAAAAAVVVEIDDSKVTDDVQ